MTERFDAKDLARAVSAGILSPGQDQALLEFLKRQPATQASFQLAHVAFYLGALLIMAAWAGYSTRPGCGLATARCC